MRFLLVAGLVASSALAQKDDFSKVEIKVIPVAGTVSVLEGAGGNIGVSVGEDGLVVVDDEFAPLAPKIEAALKSLSPKPVKFLINTHWHGDHTGGNELVPQGAPIVAQENVRKRLVEDPQHAIGKKGWPVVTFDDGLKLWANGEEIQVIHLPPGHTDGDSVILFKKSNVAHLGDDFVNGRFPYIDLASGGNVRGYAANVKTLIAKLPPNAKLIPGHGKVGTLKDLQAFSDMLEGTMAAVAAGIKAGKSLEQLKKEKVLAPWSSFAGKPSSDTYLEMIYPGLGQ